MLYCSKLYTLLLLSVEHVETVSQKMTTCHVCLGLHALRCNLVILSVLEHVDDSQITEQ